MVYAHETLYLEHLESNRKIDIDTRSDIICIELIRLQKEQDLRALNHINIYFNNDIITSVPFCFLYDERLINNGNNFTVIMLPDYLFFYNIYRHDIYAHSNGIKIPLYGFDIFSISFSLTSTSPVEYALLLDKIYLLPELKSNDYHNFVVRKYSLHNLNNVIGMQLSLSNDESACLLLDNATVSTKIDYDGSYINPPIGKYHQKIIWYNNCYTEYTKHHCHALYDSLGFILPNEIIDIIEKYLIESYQYRNMISYCKLPYYRIFSADCYDIKVTFDKSYSGKIVIASGEPYSNKIEQ